MAQINPFYFGTWKLNLAKPEYAPGPPPRNKTVTIELDGDGANRTIETLYADGARRTPSSDAIRTITRAPAGIVKQVISKDGNMTGNNASDQRIHSVQAYDRQ